MKKLPTELCTLPDFVKDMMPANYRCHQYTESEIMNVIDGYLKMLEDNIKTCEPGNKNFYAWQTAHEVLHQVKNTILEVKL